MIIGQLRALADRLYFNRALIAARLALATTSEAPGLRAKLRRKFAGDALMRRFGCYVSQQARIGADLRLPHPVGIVIGEGCRLGNRVTVFQGVTLGRSHAAVAHYPVIEDDVVIYAGAVIAGGVTVGAGAVVGANSVVTRDLPPFSVSAGVPAKVLRYLNAASSCG